MKKNLGFTLIELLVVIVIIGILTALIMINYTRMIEENRARNAVKILRMLGAARRMQLIDNGIPIYSSTITTSMFQGVTCPNDIGDIDTVGELHACGYGDLASIDWEKTYYVFNSCGGNQGKGCCGSGAPTNTVACTYRRRDNAPKFSKYWMYHYTADGRCIDYDAMVDTPSCLE